MGRLVAAAHSVLLFLLLVVQPIATSCFSSSYTPHCKTDLASLALLSCNETTPQAPTKSCCDALLFAIDIWPDSAVDKGICCLCMYLLHKRPGFDLGRAYVTCGGKDSLSVRRWLRQHRKNPKDCNDACGLAATTQQNKQPVGLITTIVLCSVAAVVALGICLYRTYFSPAKARTSPDLGSPVQDGVVSPGRISSARFSASPARLSSARARSSTARLQ